MSMARLTGVIRYHWETGAYGDAHLRLSAASLENLRSLPFASRGTPMDSALRGIFGISMVADDTIEPDAWKLVRNSNHDDVVEQGTLSSSDESQFFKEDGSAFEWTSTKRNVGGPDHGLEEIHLPDTAPEVTTTTGSRLDGLYKALHERIYKIPDFMVENVVRILSPTVLLNQSEYWTQDQVDRDTEDLAREVLTAVWGTCQANREEVRRWLNL